MKYFAFAAAAALAALAPSVSQATTIYISGGGNPLGVKDGTLSFAPSSYNGQTVTFGQFLLNGVNQSAGNAPVSLLTYCVDLTKSLAIPGTYTLESLSFLSQYTPAKALNLTKLLANTNATTTDESAAIQLAVWEIVFDNSSTVSAGAFSMAGGSSAAAVTKANQYLGQLGTWTTNGRSASLLYSETNQSQVFLNAVPEAATWGMMVVGFGVVGASLRRRTKVSYRIA